MQVEILAMDCFDSSELVTLILFIVAISLPFILLDTDKKLLKGFSELTPNQAARITFKFLASYLLDTWSAYNVLFKLW